MSNVGKIVLIRSYAAGVHFGTLVSEAYTPAGKEVVLTNTRRVHYWSGAASLSQMAAEGVKNPGDCRFTMEIPSNTITNVIEVMPLSESAIVNLQNVPVWNV